MQLLEWQFLRDFLKYHEFIANHVSLIIKSIIVKKNV